MNSGVRATMRTVPRLGRVLFGFGVIAFGAGARVFVPSPWGPAMFALTSLIGLPVMFIDRIPGSWRALLVLGGLAAFAAGFLSADHVASEQEVGRSLIAVAVLSVLGVICGAVAFLKAKKT